MRVRREKLKNCIRKDAFRYYFPTETDVDRIWKALCSTYGEDMHCCPFPIREINNDSIQLRKVDGDNFISVVWLNNGRVSGEPTLHTLLGFVMEDEVEQTG